MTTPDPQAPKPETTNAAPSQSKALNWIGIGFVVAAILAACWGIMFVGSVYLDSKVLNQFSHFPFWITVGLVGVLLNYLPIAKGKPNIIPWLAIACVAGTTAWFCLDNFLELNGLGEYFQRFKFDAMLMIVCYGLTHMSLLMLTYKRGYSNVLLTVTCVCVGASVLGYVLLFYGVSDELAEAAGLLIIGVSSLFFIKFALSIATIVISLRRSRLARGNGIE